MWNYPIHPPVQHIQSPFPVLLLSVYELFYLKHSYPILSDVYEAVWNLSENRIVLGTFMGTVRAALESNAVIVCTAIERSYAYWQI